MVVMLYGYDRNWWILIYGIFNVTFYVMSQYNVSIC